MKYSLEETFYPFMCQFKSSFTFPGDIYVKEISEYECTQGSIHFNFTAFYFTLYKK